MPRDDPPHPFDLLDALVPPTKAQRADLDAAECALALRRFDKKATLAMAKRMAAKAPADIARDEGVCEATAAALRERARYWVERLAPAFRGAGRPKGKPKDGSEKRPARPPKQRRDRPQEQRQ